MDLFDVITSGAYTTVQDKGRYGFLQMGIPVCGALDPFAFRVANMLVGNDKNHAVLEMTITGPRLEVLADAMVAVTGAEISVSLNDQPIPMWRSFRVQAGDLLAIHQVKSGCRAYLAVTGGLDVPIVMGSRSTYVGGHIGGFNGRPLKAGDRLGARPAGLPDFLQALSEDDIPQFSPEIVLRAIPGPQDDFFVEGLDLLFSSQFMVSTKADRMGYRLQGPPIPLLSDKPKSIVSEPSMPGGIQIPADQQPIILLVEQTVGGYAKIATVISSDISKIAQATPGDTVRFEPTSLEETHRQYLRQVGRYQNIQKRMIKI
ncbi:MAG: biotin-dependent carboxyltransferase [Deltaproteobacteria bacterium]|nr:biotin-dependent carboxyltransferase [Deltaproteobacteria bacterium]